MGGAGALTLPPFGGVGPGGGGRAVANWPKNTPLHYGVLDVIADDGLLCLDAEKGIIIIIGY